MPKNQNIELFSPITSEKVFLDEEGVNNCYINDDELTTKQMEFYEEVNFPCYEENENLASIILKANKNEFTRKLDEEILLNTTILECGCGTGQLSNFLARKKDLISLQAAYDNAYIEDFRDHDQFFFMKKGEQLRILRSNAYAQAYHVATTKPYYIDPPVLYFNKKKKISKIVGEYILREARSSFSMTTTKEGSRTTLRFINHEKNFLF